MFLLLFQFLCLVLPIHRSFEEWLFCFYWQLLVSSGQVSIRIKSVFKSQNGLQWSYKHWYCTFDSRLTFLIFIKNISRFQGLVFRKFGSIKSILHFLCLNQDLRFLMSEQGEGMNHGKQHARFHSHLICLQIPKITKKEKKKLDIKSKILLAIIIFIFQC